MKDQDRTISEHLGMMETIYDANFGEETEYFKMAGYGSPESQSVRFNAIIRWLDIATGDSVLDVGCGYGDFYEFMLNRGVSISYTGVDVRASAVAVAATRYRSCGFIHGTAAEAAALMVSVCDWVIASGIFCFKIEGDGTWEEYVTSTLSTMLSIATKGVAVNFLYDRYGKIEHKKHAELKYTSLEEICNVVMRIPHNRFSIDHSYKNNDILVCVFK